MDQDLNTPTKGKAAPVRLPLALFGLCLLVIGAVFLWQRSDDKANSVGADESLLALQIPGTDPAPKTAGSTLIEYPQSRTTTPAHHQDLVESPPGAELWFVPADLDDGLKYRTVPDTPIGWDSSCSDHPFSIHRSLEALAKDGIKIDPSDYFASDALPMQFSQFSKSDQGFHQFSFRWDQNNPQTFTVDAFLAQDPLLSKDVVIDGDPDIPTGEGLLFSNIRSQLESNIKSLLTSSERTLGARTALFRKAARPQVSSGSEFFFAEMRNAQIVTLYGGNMTCQKSATQQKAFCSCSQSGGKQ